MRSADKKSHTAFYCGRGLLKALFPWLIYPGLMGSIVTLHIVSIDGGFGLAVSTFAPLLLAAVVVTGLEALMPYRREWRPGRAEVGTDLLYMAVVQLALPKILTFIAVLYLLQTLDGTRLDFELWPHAQSKTAQVFLLLLSISFIRYWVHRASHEWWWLWRLHAVHHSPNKLYWLNLGRFHPLDEMLRFLTESLPFILLGVEEEVVALYFVVLAVHGFLLHSNIALRHGVLNHLLATAELHRWHHDRDPRAAACNYGNLLIIWDTLFNTRYLSPSREVGPLGLMNKAYPRGFFAQFAAPFATDVGSREIPLPPSAYLDRCPERLR